ncbi:MAG: CRTAC1 family protein, partial [Verrucomicrobiales bacterium]|nr:CRTAC1 family protein [Verrucomicrobiales bacterium]
HIVEAKEENGTVLPWRGLSCSSGAMPFIRNKLPTFEAFGRASLNDVYSSPALEDATVRRATTLETTLFVNNSEPGKPRFDAIPLPRLAQISPSFGANLFDADGDTLTDCFLAQNFHAPQLEVGRMDSGLSMVLKGTGTSLEPVWPRGSGIAIRGDAMGSAVTDYNRDGSPDLLVAVNNGILQAYDNTTKKHLAVSLKGLPGNIHGTGARVTLTFAEPSAPTLTSEVHTGSSYLSQSSPTIFFGRASFTPKSIMVRWPDAARSKHPIPAGATSVRIPQPAG